MSKKNKEQRSYESAATDYSLAFTAFQHGESRQCIKLCCQLLKAMPTTMQAWHLLALALQQRGRTSWALRAVDIALKLEPKAAHYWNTKGAILLSRDDRLGAIDAYQHALILNPQLLDTFLNLALIFRAEQQWEREQVCYQRILLQDHEHRGALLQYGISLYNHGRLQPAIACFKRILRLTPKFALARFWLGICLQSLDLLEEAVPCYQQALRDEPSFVPSYINLGVVYKQLLEPEKALMCYQKALEYDKNIPHAYNNQGSALLKLERYDEAVASYKRAIELNSRQADAHNGLGYAWQMQNELDKAQACYEEAISLQPNHVDAHFNLATVLFLQGQFAAAWTEYAWRWQRAEMTMLRNLFRLPRWGGQLPKGKKILVFAEQGFGDNIQFARYIPLLIVEGARVYVETYPELISLFQSIKGVTELIKRGGSLPACDFMVPIISLAEFFTESEADIPRTFPYLAPVGAMKPKLTKLTLDPKKKKIGICAAGKKSHRNNHNRSCDFDVLVKKLHGKNRQLISLQRPAPDLKNHPDIIDASSLCDDFNDMAHVIEQLDLVVTVDTSLAHLAGALNIPVWVLLPYVPDWRWQLERTDSPWYPSMRLFRQDVRGDWKPVMKALGEAIDNDFPK